MEMLGPMHDFLLGGLGCLSAKAPEPTSAALLGRQTVQTPGDQDNHRNKSVKYESPHCSSVLCTCK